MVKPNYCFASNRPKNFDNNFELESAIADIQLFGNLKQVTLAAKFANDIAQNSNASTNELLSDLRASLRNELKLENTNSETIFLRLDTKQ